VLLQQLQKRVNYLCNFKVYFPCKVDIHTTLQESTSSVDIVFFFLIKEIPYFQFGL